MIGFSVLLDLLCVEWNYSPLPLADPRAPLFPLQVKEKVGEVEGNSTASTSSSTPRPHPPLQGTPSPTSPAPWNQSRTPSTRTSPWERLTLTSTQPHLQVCVCVCGSNPMFSFSASYFLRSHGADLVTAHINCSQRQKRNRIRCIYSSELKLCWRCKKTLKVTPGIWLMTFFGFLKLRNNLFLWVWATQVKRLKILFYFRINYSLYLRFYLMCFCVSSQKKYLVCIILGSFVLLLGSVPY